MTDPIVRRGALWGVLMAASGLLLGLRVLPNLQVQTDLLALLPQQHRDSAVEQALARMSAAFGRRALLLVGAPDFAAATAAAERIGGRLRAQPLFNRVRWRFDTDGFALPAVYRPYLPALLSAADRRALRAGDAQRIATRARARLYAPLSGPQWLAPAQDPLGLATDFLQARFPPLGNPLPRDGWLTVSAAGRSYVLIELSLRGDAFSATVERTAHRVFHAALSDLPAGIEVLRSGVIFHAAAAARQAHDELSRLSIASLLLVAAVLVACFASPLPLLVSAVSIAFGALAGLLACYEWFGGLHVLTLVFGSSLIGVAIDYSIYFLADRARDPEHWTPAVALRRVRAPIALGLATTLLGYVGLLLAPFPGLQQIAVFSAAGLIGAAGCVLFLYPLLLRRGSPLPAVARGVAVRLANRRPAASTRAIGLALLALLAAGVLRLNFVDDIRLLQAPQPRLLTEERRVQALLGTALDSQFFLIRGDDPQQVLQREEALTAALDRQVAAGRLRGYSAISRALPSLATQRADHALLQRTVYADGGLLPSFMRSLGFDATAIRARQRAFAQVPPSGLQFEPWLKSEAAEPYRALWLGSLAGGVATAVTVSGIRDATALAAIHLPGVQWIDEVAKVSATLAAYRRVALWLLAGFYLAVGLALALRYGWRGAARVLWPSAAASLAMLGALGWVGVSANLFTVLALLLVLGIGVDYAIFLYEGGDAVPSVCLAVLAAAATTLASFGLLAISRTPFIRSLGLALLLGIGFAFMLALFSAAGGKRNGES